MIQSEIFSSGKKSHVKNYGNFWNFPPKKYVFVIAYLTSKMCRSLLLLLELSESETFQN